MRKFLILTILFACSPSEDDKILEQSMEIHEVAIKTGKEVSDKIKQAEAKVEQMEDSLKVSYQESIALLNEKYEAWESSIVEVPGHEEHDHHHHDHDHDHDHDHAPSPDLTPKMVLEIQTELRDQAMELNGQAQGLLDTIEKLENESAEEKEEEATGNGA